MQTRSSKGFSGEVNFIRNARAVFALVPATLLFLSTSALRAQTPPPILWSTNLGAPLFAVDTQTNAYLNATGTVIKVSPAGVPFQTNSICPLPGIARRDSAGNYYFAGTFSGTQDFGGVVLIVPQVPTCYLAKYSPAGTLHWVTNFASNVGMSVTDLALDEDGDALVGHRYGHTASSGSSLARIAANGNILWDISFPSTFSYPGDTTVKVTPESGTSCIVFRYTRVSSFLRNLIYRVDQHGAFMLLDAPTLTFSSWSEDGKPVFDGLGNIYSVDAGDGRLNLTLLDAQSGSNLWASPTGTNASWVLERDWLDGAYVGHNSDGGAGTVLNRLARYDSDGHCLWTMTNLTSRCIAAVSDPYGNVFVSLANGSLWRIAAETALPPVITDAPVGSTVLAGSTASLNVQCSGSSPFTYTWLLDGAVLPQATKATLTMSNVSIAQSGLYTVVISNVAGSVTSTPALLRVKQVAVFAGSHLLTNGTHTFATPPLLNIRSAFSGGSIFYTLDGSAPGFASKPYSQPFTVSQNATVRALGYSSDFLQSEEADAVNIVVLENHTLTATATGGGSVVLSPPGGYYLSTNTITATATPQPGWAFLYWLGDVSGVNPVANITMERDKTIRAVFGTTLSTTVAGAGQVQLFPPGGLYSYGTVVRLTGIPDPGNYFGFWGNAASGNTNPILFNVVAPTQTVSSIFGPTPGGQAALTLLINGRGHISSNPRSNAYTLNQLVTLTAVPESGQTFLSWSGDATGNQNPLPVTMTSAKVITANFTARPALRAVPGIDGLTPQGFRFTLLSDPAIFQIYGSTNLATWVYLVTLTNTFGEIQHTDPFTGDNPVKFYKAVP